MKRLTFVDEKGNVLFAPKGCGEDVGYTIIQLIEGGHTDLLNEIANRLANYEQRLKHYEDLEEQGLLLKLPCKVGDTVYRIFMDCPRDYKPEYCTDHKGSCEKCQHRVPVIMNSTFSLQDIGKTVFLTQAEAEAVLFEYKKEGKERG